MLASLNEEPYLLFTNEFDQCSLSFVRVVPSKHCTVGFIGLKMGLKDIGMGTFSGLVSTLIKQQRSQEQQAGVRTVDQSRGPSSQIFSNWSK